LICRYDDCGACEGFGSPAVKYKLQPSTIKAHRAGGVF